MIFAHLFIGPLILIITLIFVKYPPKKINDFYGYRTSRSMINQDCWDFANKYSTALMWKSALATCISQLIAIIVLNEESALLTGVIVLIITLLYSVYLTEKALKKVFDKEGNRR